MFIVLLFTVHGYTLVLMKTFSLHRFAAHQRFTVSRGLSNGDPCGFYWHEFDPAYLLMRGLNRVGVIRLRYGCDEAYM